MDPVAAENTAQPPQPVKTPWATRVAVVVFLIGTYLVCMVTAWQRNLEHQRRIFACSAPDARHGCTTDVNLMTWLVGILLMLSITALFISFLCYTASVLTAMWELPNQQRERWVRMAGEYVASFMVITLALLMVTILFLLN